MTFETTYQLQEFEEIKHEHFARDGKCWEGHHPANHARIMEQMYNLIYQLKKEIDRQPNLLHEFFNHRSDASNVEAIQQEELEKDFMQWASE
ncbi:MAG TPA: hypothetical protein DCS12_04820 [Clostridiales bacterium]|nr:hypothetical protein [Clostridiales bacterium]